MPAAVETYGDLAAFASLREPAWHWLGTVFNDEVTTQQMLDLAFLSGWDVHLEEMETPYPYFRVSYWVVRTNPFTKTREILGIVGERYNEYQNEDLFAFGENLLTDGRWETAGSIKNGTVVFASLALERETVLDPTGVADKVNTYLLLSTSHDGSLSIQASITPVRVVCANTLDVALGGAKQKFKIRHTQTAKDRAVQARQALGLASDYMDKFDEEMASLIEAEVTRQKFWEIVEALYPKPEKDSRGSMKKWETKTELIESIYDSETTSAINGTAWGVFNALTERLDWHRNPRKGNTDNLFVAASGFDPVVTAEKQKILTVVKAFA